MRIQTKVVSIFEGRGTIITTFLISSPDLTTATVTASLSLIAVLVLLALLVQKELTLPAKNYRVQRLGQMLNVAIVPLLITFIVIAIFRVADILT